MPSPDRSPKTSTFFAFSAALGLFGAAVLAIELAYDGWGVFHPAVLGLIALVLGGGAWLAVRER
jgi:hypothetical protein